MKVDGDVELALYVLAGVAALVIITCLLRIMGCLVDVVACVLWPFRLCCRGVSCCFGQSDIQGLGAEQLIS